MSYCFIFTDWAIPFNIRTPPVEYTCFSWLYPWRIPSSKPFTPEEFQNSKLKTLYPWRIPSSKPITPEEFQNSKLKTLYPWRIPSSKPFTPEEFQAQNPLPLKNSKLKTFYKFYIWLIFKYISFLIKYLIIVIRSYKFFKMF